MKKIIFVILALSLLGFNAHALDTALLNIRDKFFEKSKEIKALFATSKDVITVSSMWDSCIIAMTQLDAYFSMVGIFNTIKKEDRKEESLNYLINWLNEIKKTNELNMKSLDNIETQAFEANTKLQIKKLKGYFSDLNKQIDSELKKVAVLKESLKIR